MELRWNKYRWILGVLLAAVLQQACKHEPALKPSPVVDTTNNGNNNNGGNTGGGNGNPADTALCFERDILPIFIANCAKSGCHDAASRQDGYQFTDYNSIVAKKFKAGDPDECELYEKITEDKASERMPQPPNPPLLPSQIALIRRWIVEGAKNTTNCGVLCDSNNTSYAAGIKPLVEQYCRGCHNSAAPSGGVALDSYDGVRVVALNGKLANVINHNPGFSPMPKGGNKLSACQVKQVEKWIAAGSPNN